MKDKLMKMMAKKKESGDMSEPEKKAKMSVLEELQKMATEAMAGRLHGMKKVQVAGSSDEALEEGLDKAKELIGGEEEAEEAAEGSEEESEDISPEEASMEVEDDMEDMDESELDAKLEKLMALKRRKGMK